MKKILTTASLIAITLLTGCSQKDADMSSSNTETTGQTQTRVLTNSDMNSVYFAFDKYNIDEASKVTIINNEKAIKDLKGTEVVLKGSTDEWGSDEYNYALGLKRAESAKSELIVAGTSAVIKTISLGESTPSCTEKTKECFAKNRRVDFLTK